METLIVADRAAWRSWLAKHHGTAKRIWLVYAKKTAQVHESRPATSIGYEESVEEALCFGWIDSLIKRIDDACYARLFTPRVDDANWSPTNRRRLAKVIAAGRMTPAGLAVAGGARTRTPAARAKPKPRKLALPADVRAALRARPPALQNFGRLPPSEQRRYVGWITHAKKQETRARRLAEAVKLLAQNRKLGLK